MLKKYKEWYVRAAVPVHGTFDPSELGDPVAMQTDWAPATKKTGADFKSHKLVESNSERLEFRACTRLKLFGLFPLGVGVVALIVFFCLALFGMSLVNWYALWLLGLGLPFTALGARVLYTITAPIVFDRQCGFFWKGRKHPDLAFDKDALKHFAELEKIHALQLISKHYQIQESIYLCYELNLVLEDSKRINVLNHGNQDKLREDADTLAAFLDKPVWDAIWRKLIVQPDKCSLDTK